MKASGSSSSPFFLLLRDSAGHVDSLQENKKFADDVSASMRNGEEQLVDRKFAVSIPRGENYFPVLRYKCVSDLRPVPIVRTEPRRNLCSLHLPSTYDIPFLLAARANQSEGGRWILSCCLANKFESQ